MRWRGRRESSNVEDQRGGGGFKGGRRRPRSMARTVGGGGIGLVIVVIVLSLLGVDPRALLEGQPSLRDVGRTAPGLETRNSARPGNKLSDELGKFVAVVLADTEDVWKEVYKKHGGTYREPKLVLFSGNARSACGFASAATGPFYCPGDNKVYIDLSFYDQLKRRFKAPGDFAQAYVIAHEVGHHVQNLTGILGKFNQARRTMSEEEANKMSIRVELQADCYAGLWAKYTAQKGLLDSGDLNEALNAAAQIGDDAIQRRTQGYVVPESFNHGTSEQRQRWFMIGYKEGTVNACNTFGRSQV